MNCPVENPSEQKTDVALKAEYEQAQKFQTPQALSE